MKDTVIVIPGLNEEKHIAATIRGVKARGYRDIVYVDDGSTDRSAAIARKAGVHVLVHPKSKGKGAALRTGCDEALRKGAARIILMDADQQHDPRALPRIERALTTYPLVYTYRSFGKSMPFFSRLGNRIFTVAIRLLYGIRVRDALSGFRGMTAEAYREVRWESDGYQIESEIIVRGAKERLAHAEVRIPTIYLETWKGTTPFDGIPILWALLRWRFRPPAHLKDLISNENP